MTATIDLHTRDIGLSNLQKERIDRHLLSLEKRLKKFKDPVIDVTIQKRNAPNTIHAGVLVTLGTAGKQLRSDEDGVSPDVAVKQAVGDIKRQLEREISQIRGEDTFGVPSRRFPSELRPHPLDDESASAPVTADELGVAEPAE